MDDLLTIFRGRRVLVTGHTGFKGAWLCQWLHQLGADVSGYALAPPTTPSLFEQLRLEEVTRHHLGDVRDSASLERVLRRERPEVVFHLAAQPLVRRSYREPRETFEVNVNGTLNLLEAVRHSDGVRVVVCVTTDKCYLNRGWSWGYRENDPLGGDDPYSASKACAELVVGAYLRSFFASGHPAVATARAGNVLGGGDWAEDRILPDCIRALEAGRPIVLRRPRAVRPWQHVLEALAGYLTLADRLWHSPAGHTGAWNFGPGPGGAATVGEVVDEVLRLWGAGAWVAAPEEGGADLHEAACLRLSIDHACAHLPWRPVWDLGETLAHTVGWYRARREQPGPAGIRRLCREQISAYQDGWLGRRRAPADSGQRGAA